MRGKFIALFIVVSLLSNAQEIEVRGGFVQDSLKIGLNVEYWMTAKYPMQLDLSLPDSNFNFTPFEFGGRTYFETKGDSTMALDSVIYSLISFEIDPIQYLKLPAVVLSSEDSTQIFTNQDSVYLIELVAEASDTTSLITNTEFQEVSRDFNRPFLMIVLGILGVIALTILLVFGKKIRRHFVLKRMNSAHQKFLESMGQQIENLKGNGSPEIAESTLGIWKNYQEKIEKKPFTKLTSKEMTQYDFAKELADPLKAIDRCVYGKMESESVYQDFQHLEGFTQNRYNQHVEKIKNGE